MDGAATLYGYAVESDFPLDCLGAGEGTRGSLRILRADRPLDALRGTEVHRAELGHITFSLVRVGDGRLLARCSATGSFLIDAGAATIWSDAGASVGWAWEHRLTGTVAPLLLAERGDYAVHAAALSVDGSAVVVAGASGRGKSTVTSAAAVLGHRILTEEGAVLTRESGAALAWPGARAVRVASDVCSALGLPPPRGAGTRKVVPALDADVYADEPAPLRAIVLLGERVDGALELEQLGSAEAVPFLLPNLVWSGTDRLASAFAAAADLARTSPVFRCRMPDDLRAAPAALSDLLSSVLAA